MYGRNSRKEEVGVGERERKKIIPLQISACYFF
jgi:hypothetical protein